MKNVGRILTLTVVALSLHFAVELIFRTTYAQAQPPCCVPPLKSGEAARFAQGTRVNIYIDSSSGLTGSEINAIKSGLKEWNFQTNNSGVKFDITITDLPPAAGGHNTIIVAFQNSSGLASTRINTSGPNIYGTMFFKPAMRNEEIYDESLEAYFRETARHEGGHILGLDNLDDSDCPHGSSIMKLDNTQENFINDCDNAAINSDPNYPTPEPSPSPSVCEPSQEYLNWCWEMDYALDYGSCVCGPTPILVDINGDGFALTGTEMGTLFDINADGTLDSLGWTKANSDDAWLVLDRNGNGNIDNGTELFGDFTTQAEPSSGENKNGFLALAQYDMPAAGGNTDGRIDGSDSVFYVLRLWQDKNHNGVSELSELHTLSALGLEAVNLQYKESKKTDEHGNRFRYRARVRDARGAQIGRWAWDVYLVTQP